MNKVIEFNFEREPRDINFVKWCNNHKEFLSTTFFNTSQDAELTYCWDTETYHDQTFEEWVSIMYQVDIEPVRSYNMNGGYIFNECKTGGVS